MKQKMIFYYQTFQKTKQNKLAYLFPLSLSVQERTRHQNEETNKLQVRPRTPRFPQLAFAKRCVEQQQIKEPNKHGTHGFKHSSVNSPKVAYVITKRKKLGT